MKAFLMHRDRDFDPHGDLPAHAADLVQDLDLDPVLEAMAQEDPFLKGVATHALLASLRDAGEVAYRQDVLRDCMDHPELVRELYGLSVEAMADERKIQSRFFFSRSPDLILAKSVRLLELLAGVLRRLAQIARSEGERFRSEGFRRFFAMLQEELTDDYLASIEAHLRQLTFPHGIQLSAQLGKGLKGVHYVLRQSADEKPTLIGRILGKGRAGLSFEIADRDEAGHQAVSELRGRGLNPVANALAQSADHVLSFFRMLQADLGFYVGCLNLQASLTALGEPIAMPRASAKSGRELEARGLYDPSLALKTQGGVVGNDLGATDRPLVVVTGANQGGKSTFLRSLGIAFLMLQSGMFVAAEEFSASLCDGLHTHFQRAEDETMTRGRLDEELARMRTITDSLRADSLLLLNESFASTNEIEGSEIASQIVRALLDAGVRVVFVTHLFTVAEELHLQRQDTARFLRAQRQEDGIRTFRLLEGEPLPSSNGIDLYRQVFPTG